MTITTDRPNRATILAAAAVAAAAVWAAPIGSAAAALDRAAPRVALGTFRGPESMRVRAAVEDQLVDHYVLLPEALIADSARRSGIRLKSDRAFAEVGKDLNVAAFVTATVRRTGNWRVEMTVRQGDTGRTLGQFDWSDTRIDKLTSNLGRTLAKRMHALLVTGDVVATGADRGEPKAAGVERTAPPQPPDTRLAFSAPASAGSALAAELAPVQEQDHEAEHSPAAVAVERAVAPQGGAPVRSYCEFAIGGRVFNRTLSYADNFSRVPGYSLSRAFAANGELALHPFGLNASTRDSNLAAIGIIGAVTFAPGFESSGGTAGGRSQTQVNGYEVGIRLRTTVRTVEVLPRMSYLVDSFVMQLGPQSPDVTYRTARLGVQGRFAPSDRFTTSASIDYLHVMSAGALTGEERFSRATVRGIDLTLGAGYRVMDTVEVQLLTGFRRYAFDMNARPTDTVIVGGASDRYLSMTLGLAYRPPLGRN